jgi:hypothetical protein
MRQRRLRDGQEQTQRHGRRSERLAGCARVADNKRGGRIGWVRETKEEERAAVLRDAPAVEVPSRHGGAARVAASGWQPRGGGRAVRCGTAEQHEKRESAPAVLLLPARRAWRGVGGASRGRRARRCRTHPACVAASLRASSEERTARLLLLRCHAGREGERNACLEQSAGAPVYLEV